MKTAKKMTTPLVGAVVAASAIAALSLSASAPATSGIAGDWQSTYPSSASLTNANSCNLCHSNGPGGFGSNFNNYGKDIQDLLDAGSTNAEAFALLDDTDSDTDPTGSTNLEEITADTQPGWTPGANNTTWTDSTPSENQEPAPGIQGDLDPTACPADLDGNGSVGFADLQILLQSWGPCPAGGDCPADLDDNGSVGFADLQILLQSWGECP